MSKTNRARSAAHESREAESRVNEVVHEEEDEPWVRGASLAMPPARPGMDQRWIAFAINGHETPTNYMRKLREGWKPRSSDSIPQDFPVPTVDHGKWAGCIVVEGSVLCERPISISQRRDRHFKKVTETRTAAIDRDLDGFNKENRNPAFGPIKKVIGNRQVLREVNIMSDDDAN